MHKIKDLLIEQRFSIDTRTLSYGDVFVAINGKNFHGDMFIEEALLKGASWVITETAYESEKCIAVPNSLMYMQELATYKRSKLGATVICITGSVGKTTTKEILYNTLSKQHRTFRTMNNFNNYIGLPLSILNTPNNIEFAIYEIGISKVGEMSELAKIAQPNIAIITSIANTHLEFFQSIAVTANEKIKILDGMTGGTLFFTSESAFTDYFKEICLMSGINFLTFTDSAPEALLQFLGEKIDKTTLFNTSPLPGRGKVYEINDGITLLDHSYNACIDSIRFCAKELSKYDGRRKVMILGDLLEVGIKSKEEHMKILPIIDKYSIDKVYLCGDNIKEIFELMDKNKQGEYFQNVYDLLSEFPKFLEPHDVVSVKGSHDVKLNLLFEKINADRQ